MATRKSRLLLADNNAALTAEVRSAAPDFGFEIISTHLGAWVRDLAVRAAPDLIVLDIVLGDGDGRDILALLKRDARTAHIPVLVWSGRPQGDSDRRISLDLGAEDYADKHDAREMLSKARRILLRFQ